MYINPFRNREAAGSRNSGSNSEGVNLIDCDADAIDSPSASAAEVH